MTHCTACGGRGSRPSGAGDSDPCHACAGTGERHVQVAQMIFDEGWVACAKAMTEHTRRVEPPMLKRSLVTLAEGLREGE